MFRCTSYGIILAILLPLIIADDPCWFQSEHGVIDLSSLCHTDGTAAFPDRFPSQGSLDFKYSYNPCRPFSEGSTCENVAACQISNDGQHTYTLGKQDSATWDAGNSSNPTIRYQFNEKIVHVNLHCTPDSSSSDLQVIDESPINVYNFNLMSKCACWNGCLNATSTTTITTETTTETTEMTTFVTTANITDNTTQLSTTSVHTSTNTSIRYNFQRQLEIYVLCLVLTLLCRNMVY